MIKFLKKWFGKKKEQELPYEEEEDVKESAPLRRDRINLHEKEQRQRYLQSCLEQMKDAETEIGELKKEYGVVTAYLTDMEEIEALPPQQRKKLNLIADKIVTYEAEKNLHEEGTNRMAEADFERMDRMGEEAGEGIDKLTEAEDYQGKIRQDMRRLSGERHAYQYRKHELSGLLVNLRGMVIITAFSFLACMGILLSFQLLMEMEVRIGYLLASGAAAIAIFLIYLKYMDSMKEKGQVERAINRLILLQNRVKIRYVNNTNLLEYLRMKYGVKSAQELIDLWEDYETEKEERAKCEELHAELVNLRGEMLTILRGCRIRYPEIWLHQAEALIKKGEMVEIRHGLILRRQKLRAQMDYNEHLAESAQGEIRSLAEEFPIYAPEIMELVSQYEENEGNEKSSF